MAENATENAPQQFDLQAYLSAGYVYLIFLGIIDEVIFYSFFKIDILNYSGISDILMAPINTLLSDLRVFGAVLIIMLIAYFFYFKLLPAFHHKSKTQAWYQRMVPNIEQADAKLAKLESKKLIFICIYLSCLFLGLRIGFGHKMKDRIDKGEFKHTHTLILNDNSSKTVRIIGQNSLYVFYVTKEKRDISIVPIGGNIKEIQRLNH